MTRGYVALSDGRIGTELEKETVTIVSVRLPDGSDDPAHEWGVHDDPDEGEREAIALALRLGLVVSDERASADDDEFMAGYRDGGDPNAPEPSANRSHAYRHSFEVKRAELRGAPIPAAFSRAAAAEASKKDAAQRYQTTSNVLPFIRPKKPRP